MSTVSRVDHDRVPRLLINNLPSQAIAVWSTARVERRPVEGPGPGEETGEFYAVRRLGLSEQVGHVGRDGFLTDHQGRGDVAIGEAADQQSEYLPLPRSQVREAGVIEGHGWTRRPQSHVGEPGQVREFGADRLGSEADGKVVPARS